MNPKAAPALMLAALACTAPAALAHVGGKPSHDQSRLVVRGEDTVSEAVCQPGVCRLALTGGAFRGDPVGSGAYAGSIRLRVAASFPNGEGGTCAPVDGELTLGGGTPDRLVIAVYGDSCQDGKGDVRLASFTTLAHFRVESGTGRFAGARGRGVASFTEDAQDHEHVTLIGSVTS
jgi:hypothetical protein